MSLSIFQIWESMERQTPFIVRQVGWSDEFFTVVEDVNGDNPKRCFAFGYPTAYGRPSDHYEYNEKWRLHRRIPNANKPQWELVDIEIKDSLLLTRIPYIMSIL
jgi:hypothetical protein